MAGGAPPRRCRQGYQTLPDRLSLCVILTGALPSAWVSVPAASVTRGERQPNLAVFGFSRMILPAG
jgi:hypothetical protein